MAITQCQTTSYKKQLLEAVHDFRLSGGDTFKIALYVPTANLGETTSAYTTTDEVGNSGTYAAGGGTLTRIDPTTSGTTAFTDFADINWTSATISARGAMIYNSTPTHTYTNPSCIVLDFGSTITSTAGTFTVTFPAASSTEAIIRIA